MQEFDKKCKQPCPLPDGEFYAKIAHIYTGETVISVVDWHCHSSLLLKGLSMVEMLDLWLS